MANIYQRGKTATQFTNELDNLRNLLKASYIDEGLNAEHTDKFRTKKLYPL